MNQKEVGTWHHHSRTTPAVLFSICTYSAHSRSETRTGSGIGFTSPPQTNSEVLRGPLSGKFMILLGSLQRSMPDRGCALFADLLHLLEAGQAEGLDQLVRFVVGDGVGHGETTDRRRLEA